MSMARDSGWMSKSSASFCRLLPREPLNNYCACKGFVKNALKILIYSRINCGFSPIFASLLRRSLRFSEVPKRAVLPDNSAVAGSRLYSAVRNKSQPSSQPYREIKSYGEVFPEYLFPRFCPRRRGGAALQGCRPRAQCGGDYCVGAPGGGKRCSADSFSRARPAGI